MRFRTKSSTIYIIDAQNRLFYGGKFKNPIPYVSCQAIIGTQAIIYTCDGRVIRTSIVEAYV